MARTRKPKTRICTVTGMETNVDNFYANQTDTVESAIAKPPKQQDDQQGTYNLKTSMLR